MAVISALRRQRQASFKKKEKEHKERKNINHISSLFIDNLEGSLRPKVLFFADMQILFTNCNPNASFAHYFSSLSNIILEF
jgi:hypothetical protein